MSGTAPDPSADLEAAYRQLYQQAVAPAAVQTPQGPTASSHEGRGFLSLLGEALGGGQQYGTTAEREQGGISALGALGQRMLQASDYSQQRHSLGAIIGQGMAGAQESLAGTQQVSAAQQAALQDYQQKQQEMSLARVKEALPILTQLQTLRQAAAVRTALGGTPGTTPGTSIAGAGDGLTGDKAHDMPIIAQRESGGDPTALNYVAKADPSAYDRGATASGKYQIVNSTWREGMQLAGLDPTKYATARDAPESVQDQVASAIYDKYGNKPWQKGSKDWVKDESGQYHLATVRPPAGTPGAPKPAAPGGPPSIAQGDTAHPELAPGPPGSTAAGPPVSFGTAVGGGPTLPVPPIPPPAVAGTPIPAGNLQSTGKPPGQAAADVIQRGVQLAQATPLVRGTGQEAGPSSAVATLATPPAAPQAGWGTGGATGYSDGPTAGPPVVAAPQAPPQAQQPPPAVTPPDVTAPPVEPFVYNRGPLPASIQNKLDHPEQFVSPDLLTVQRATQAGGDVGEMLKAKAAVGAAADKVRAEAATEAEAYHTNERNKQQEFRQKQIDAQQAIQLKQIEANNAVKLKEEEGRQTRITNKEAVFNQANQKGLEEEAAQQAASHGVVGQLEGFRSISDNVGQPGWLQTTKWPGSDQTIAEKLQQTGIAKLDDTAGVQLLRGGITNLVKTLRAGMPMGSLSDRDLNFIERMGPTEWMDPDTRLAAVGYLQQAYRQNEQFHRDVQREMSRGKNYGDAIDAVSARQKPFVPQVPADLTAHWNDNTGNWKQQRQDWAEKEDVRPGTLIHMANGKIVVLKTPKPDSQ